MSFSGDTYAVDSINFSAEQVSADDWVLKDTQLSISQLNQASQQTSLLSAQLILPPPLKTLSLLNISCQHFKWQENNIQCAQGRGRFKSKLLQSLAFDFSFQLQENNNHISIKKLSLLGGVFAIDAQQIAQQWQVHIQAEGVNLSTLKTVFPDLKSLPISAGLVDFELELKGQQAQLEQLSAQVVIKDLSLQDATGTLATEALLLTSELYAGHQGSSAWQWQNTTELLAGGIYVEPVFLELKAQESLKLKSSGLWLAEQQRLILDQFSLNHADMLTLTGKAAFNYQTALSIDSADVTLHIPELSQITPVYVLPFLESSNFEELRLAGLMTAQFSFKQAHITTASLILKNVMLALDESTSFQQANAHINWAAEQQTTADSFINWQQLTLQSIPFQAGRLDFSLFAKQFELLQPADLKLLGGHFLINRFDIAATEGPSDANVHFNGALKELSLAQLSKVLGWGASLTGSLSGDIPSVRYQDKKLSLDGELKMQLFDGEVSIKDLALSGLFTDFPQFYIDIAFDNLDLKAITQQFDVGHIEGRLSGTVQDLYMENWRPITFYAWIGTPDDDRSTHKISQRAIENIATIGGGGISDALSRGFMSLFSTFKYKKLGFGCYLYQGVCQLMGVEATDNGFYLIKGGGLPRIDVIGYNPSLDWDILVQRLGRIETSDEVVIE